MTPLNTQLLSLSLAVAFLSGCGGGGGGGASSSPAPAPAPSPSDYLATVEISSGTGKTLLIFDPAEPNTPRLSVSLSATENYETELDFRVDAAAGKYTLNGESKVFYVKNRQVFQVSLRKADTTVARRISSLATACAVSAPLSEALLEVSEAGADGDCATTADNRSVYVRFDSPSTEAPAQLPDGVELIEALPDATYTTTVLLLAQDTRGATPKLTLYSPQFSPLGDVVGGQGVNDFELSAVIPAQGQLAYTHTDNTLRRLSWSATGATLQASLYTFTSTPTADSLDLRIDGNTLYFTDGLAIRRMVGTGAVEPMTTLSPTLGDQLEFVAVLPTHLILRQSSSSAGGSDSILSLARQGNALHTLVTAPSTYPLGSTDNSVFYQSAVWSAGFSFTSSTHRVNLDGSNDTVIVASADQSARGIYQREWSFNRNVPLDGFWWCERAAGDTNCRNGTVKQYKISTGVTTTLGQLSHAGQYTSWDTLGAGFSLVAFFDSPLVIHARGLRQGSSAMEDEIYIAQPGVANSLVRTSLAP